MGRRKSREAAMKLVFEMSINKINCEEIIENFKENSSTDMNEIDMEYVKRCVKGIETNSTLIDEKIEKYLINWKIGRLSKIDLAILRICTYEIFYEADIPDKVSINEAVELAKIYSDEKSAAFINGVVDKMVKSKQPV